MMNRAIEISVILPAFNADRFIEHAVRSVLSQTFPHFELIIIDDGSTDATNRLIRQFKDPRIRLIEHATNKGLCHARNAGLKAARGRWIAPIDADDAWHMERLAKLFAIAQDRQSVFVGSDLMICFSGGHYELLPWKSLTELRGLKAKSLIHVKPADLVKYGLSVLPIFPADTVRERNILFREEFKGHEWLCFLFELYESGLEYVILNEPLYYYRVSPGSDSTDYHSIATQVAACAFLGDLLWLDPETRSLIRKSGRVSSHRLFTIALQEKLWNKALRRGLCDPLSLVYAIKRFPFWVQRRWIARKMRITASSAGTTGHGP